MILNRITFKMVRDVTDEQRSRREHCADLPSALPDCAGGGISQSLFSLDRPARGGNLRMWTKRSKTNLQKRTGVGK
jgi:hypothetical protein